MPLVQNTHSNSLDYEIKTEDVLSENIGKEKEKTCYCKFCDFVSKMNRTLQVHVEMNHIKLRFLCSTCEYNTKEKYVAKKHIVYKHVGDSDTNVIYHCGLCGEKCRGKESNYLKHISEKHDVYLYIYSKRKTKSTVFQCEYCSARF